MMKPLATVGLMTILTLAGAGPAFREAPSRPDPVQRAATSVDGLRALGPAGLREALRRYDEHPDPRRLPELDAVAGQRDALWSRLYWYTDLDRAMTAARAERKPILYLRLLGNLTDEYSCANSRFFRTVLYANADVSRLLRERFVLVWESERPVPTVTIDYGDGRLLKRTLTGNSIHYVLDADGRLVDALPGLFDPRTFAELLAGAATAAADGSTPARLAYWTAQGATTGGGAEPRDEGFPDAEAAAPLALSKSGVEAPVLRRLSPELADSRALALLEAGNAAPGPAGPAPSMLDASAIDLMKHHDSTLADPAKLARTVARLEGLIARDTRQNLAALRPRILAWLREGAGATRLDELNTRVYAELFLTPRADPWLGLAPEAGYSGLTEDGRVVAGN
jgi:hypothetical protein